MKYGLNIPKVDYRIIARRYDRGRPITDTNLETIRRYVSDILGPPPRKILYAGSGTGRIAIPMAEWGYELTGIDGSEEMLAKAMEKQGSNKVKWEQQDATHLNYRKRSFDGVFMSHLLHHIDEDKRQVMIDGFYDILRKKGAVINRYGALEDIINDPEHTFIPGALAIDRARTPTRREVEQLFERAGFVDIWSDTIEQQTYESPEQRLEKTSNMSTSVLSMIEREQLEEGIELLREYIRIRRDDPWILKDNITFTSGYKPE